MKITYVTGNWAKIKTAKLALEPLGFEIDNITWNDLGLSDIYNKLNKCITNIAEHRLDVCFARQIA